jgi:hypothetical protein
MASEEAREVYLVGASAWHWTPQEAPMALFGLGRSNEDAEKHFGRLARCLALPLHFTITFGNTGKWYFFVPKDMGEKWSTEGKIPRQENQLALVAAAPLAYGSNMGWLSLRGRYTLTGNLQPGATATFEPLLTQLFGDITHASGVCLFDFKSEKGIVQALSALVQAGKLPKPESTAEREAAVEAAAAAAAAELAGDPGPPPTRQRADGRVAAVERAAVGMAEEIVVSPEVQAELES